MRLLFILLVGFTGFGCAETPDAADTPTPSAEAVSIPEVPAIPLDTAIVAGLQPDIGDSLAWATARYVQQFQQVRTSDELVAVYTDIRNLSSRINQIIAIPYEVVYRWSDSLRTHMPLPGLVASCVAECTEAVFSVRTTDFLAKAEQTEATYDEDFFQLMEDVYWGELTWFDGTQVDNPIWFEKTWDYGGSSVLGDSVHVDVLHRILGLKAEAPEALQEDLRTMRTDVFNDIIGQDRVCTTYMNPLGPIQTEINAVLALDGLADGERNQLTTRLAEFDDLVANQIEVNCREGACTCGQG